VIPLTKKNYIKIAEVLADTLYKASDSQMSRQKFADRNKFRNLCTPWVDYLASDNPSFDPKRFIDYTWDVYSLAMGHEAIEK
jgi:hypothetical protein